MKTYRPKWLPKLGNELDHEDIRQASLVEEMMKSEAWQVYEALVDSGWEEISVAAMNKKLETSSDEAVSFMKGFRTAKNIAQNFVARANAYLEKEEEDKKAGSQVDEFIK